jgi:hypothetical protein
LFSRVKQQERGISAVPRVARWFYFHTKNPYMGVYILKGLGMQHVGIFYGHSVYFNAKLVFCVVFWYIFPFWSITPRKIWQPWYHRFYPSELSIPTDILLQTNFPCWGKLQHNPFLRRLVFFCILTWPQNRVARFF